MTIKRSALAIVLVAGIGVVFALSAATGAAGESKTAKLAKGGFVMHDFGVTLFPTFMNDAQPTCALQSPRWIYKGEDLQQEEFEELWDNMTSVAGQTPTGWTVTNSDPFLTFHPADAAGWPSAGLEVDVSISFDGGHPFYWYPAGDAGTNESIEWKDLKLSKALPGNLKLQKARKIAVEKKYVDHWYEEARKGGSLYTISGKTADKVLFYGGFMKMKPAVSITKKDSNFYITSLLGTTLKNVVFIEKRGKEIHYARIDSLAPGVKDVPVKAIKLKMTVKKFADEEGSRWGLSLAKAGLKKNEVNTVVRMMRTDLLEADGIRAIYLARGKVVEEMAKVTVTPAPIKTVRTSLCAVILK